MTYKHMEDDAKTFDRVRQRANEGRSPDRLINQNEYLSVIRWGVYCQNKMDEFGKLIVDQHQASLEAMLPHPDPVKTK